MPVKSKISAIVMASGEGSRMQASLSLYELPELAGLASTNKLKLPLAGKPVYSYVFDLLNEALKRKLIDEVIVVGTDEELKEACQSLGFIFIYNSCAQQGKSTSIRLGAQAAQAQHALFYFVADQPLMTISSIKAIIEAYHKHEGRFIVCPKYESRRGNPVIFPPKTKEALCALEADEGGVKIFENFEHLYLDIQKPDDDALPEDFDMDTAQEYVQLLAELDRREKQASKPALRGAICIVRGAGDLATGLIQALMHANMRVLALELERPLTIRRTVAVSDAVYTQHIQVEDLEVKLCESIEEMKACWQRGKVALAVDPHAHWIERLKEYSDKNEDPSFIPQVVIDASLAKRDIGTRASMAPISLALGPGYSASPQAQALSKRNPNEPVLDCVIETQRGHNLGRMILEGCASKNTGVPGMIGGYSHERVIHAPASGLIENLCEIGELVKKGQVIAYIKPLEEKQAQADSHDERSEAPGIAVVSKIDGLLRGLIRSGLIVKTGLKIADVDPRGSAIDYLTISDKARALGGACLQALLHQAHLKGINLYDPQTYQGSDL